MKKLFLAGVAALVVLTGCARHYKVTMTNGTSVTAYGKPQLKGGAYIFKDDKGQLISVPAGRVREIAPGSESHVSF